VAIWITVWIQGLFSGFVTVGGKWLTVRHRYRDTGKTCLGGGMHCPSASSFIL